MNKSKYPDGYLPKIAYHMLQGNKEKVQYFVQRQNKMRKVTQQAVEAFESGRSFKSGNTQVRVLAQNGGGSLVLLELHGNAIARHESWNGRTFITSAGWETRTTKERLNGLDGVSIFQDRGVWYLNGEAWDGKWIDPQTGKRPTT